MVDDICVYLPTGEERNLKHGAAIPVVGADHISLVHMDDLLRQGTCLKAPSSDAQPYYSKCFRVLRENPFSNVENGLLQKQPIKVHVSASIYYFALFFAFFVCRKAHGQHHPYHRSNRSDKEKAERLPNQPD
ncbi:MAG: hypothetical protein ACLUS6_10235 [Dysosmobacter sp.]